MPIANVGLAAPSPKAPLSTWKYEVRDPRDDDIKIEVHYCGVCHSDIHSVRDDWFPGLYPMVPGHEVTGVVTEVGSKVTKWKVGDRVGVGCMVASCRNCIQCKRDMENYCDNVIFTYNAKMPDGEVTYGGYGKYVVVREDFVIRIPDSLGLDVAAPLLCAGITTFSPLKRNGINKGGHKVGVIGLGGLGHMAVQYAHAMGNEVYVFTRSLAKADLAKKLGANDVIVSSDQEAMMKHAGTMDFIIDTVSAKKPMADYINLLAVDGVIVLVGNPPVTEEMSLTSMSLIMRGRTIKGSLIGGIKDTQEALDFAAEKGVKPMIEMIKGDYINEAFNRMERSDVQFRFVIDIRETHKGN